MAKITSKLILAFLLLFILATAEIAAAERQRYCPERAKRPVPCQRCNEYCIREERKHHGRCLDRGGRRYCYCYRRCRDCDDLEDSEEFLEGIIELD